MKNLLFLAIGIFICIAVLLGVLVMNKKLSTKPHPSQNRSVSQVQNNTSQPTVPRNLPTESCKQFPLAQGCGVVGAQLNICSKQYPNYPPLSDISSTKTDPNTGTYSGNITHIDPQLHAITVTSARSGNSFVYNGGSVNGKMVDMHNTPITNFYTLKTGVNVVVSFKCDQKNGFFTLNRFQLSQ